MARVPAARIPNWVLAIGSTLVASGITAGTVLVVDTRVSVARLEERVARAEKDTAAVAGLPSQVAELKAKIEAMGEQIAGLRTDLKGRTR